MKIKNKMFNGFELSEIERVTLSWDENNCYAYYFFFFVNGKRCTAYILAANLAEFMWKLSERIVHGDRNQIIHLYGGMNHE